MIERHDLRKAGDIEGSSKGTSGMNVRSMQERVVKTKSDFKLIAKARYSQ
jgi:hypothetical protein